MRGKALWMSLMMILALLFLAKTSLDISSAFQASSTIQLLNVNMQKQLLMNRIMSSLGYGGVIHAFKDYELRHKDKFYTYSLEGLAESESLISSYLKLGRVSDKEALQLEKLLELIGFIKTSLLPMKQMISDRVKSQDMDKQLDIEFRPYRDAIDVLLSMLEQEKMQGLKSLLDQNAFLYQQALPVYEYISLFNKVSQSMGYGGVIHLYKNYLLHGKGSERDLFHKQLMVVSGAIQELKASGFNVGDETNQVFETLTQLPIRYAKAMHTLTDLRTKGVSLHRLVFKGRVKQDKIYIQNLNQLNQLITQQFIDLQGYNRIYLDDLVATSQENLMIAIMAILICIILSIYLFAMQMPRLMSKSIDAVRHMTDKSASEVYQLAKRKDEFGALATAIEFSANALIEEEKARQKKMAQETLCVEEEQRQMRAQHREQLAGDFEKSLGVIISDVSVYVEQAHQQAKVVNEMSNRLMEQSKLASDSSQQGVVFVESTESLSGEVQKSARDISEQSKGASTLAGQAMNDTQEINQVIDSLTEVSNRIGSVVGSISSIARNTRLLSMNATIEGASAGEAGKGFAVVANEVKELASESAGAVEYIRKEITYMQKEIVSTASMLTDTIQNIGDVSEGVQIVYNSVNSQVEVIQNVANNAEQASKSMQNVVKVVDQLSGAAGESERSSTALYSLINKVDAKMKDAEESMQKFLQEIRK